MRFKQILCRIILATVLLLGNTATSFGVLDNKGKDFIMAFLPNLTQPATELHLTSDVNTKITIEYPVNSPTFTTTVDVTPGIVQIVSIPAAAAQAWSPNGIMNNCVHAYANEEFICYMINRSEATSDAGLALPTDVLNTEYIALDYSTLYQSEIAIYAIYDETAITITPSKTMEGDRIAAVPFTLTLKRGEGYFNVGTVAGPLGDLSGTVIKADKPIGLINGNKCTDIPLGTYACDHIFEIAQPIQSWGKVIPVVNLPRRDEGSIYKIVASEDNTTVKLDGVDLVSLNKGQVFESQIISGSHVFKADKPIFVAQFMTGQDRPNTNFLGDPAMGNMIPIEQYLESYTFSTVGGDQFKENYVTIIAQNADIGTNLTLDGSLLPAEQFSPIPGSTLSWVTVLLTSGTHTTSSTSGHGITVEGYDNYDSYLYPGGGRFQFINPVGDDNAPVCALVVNDLIANGTASDNRPSEDINNNDLLDEGEDLNNNGSIDIDKGIFTIQLEPGSSNISLNVPHFIPGTKEVIHFTATLTDKNMNGSGVITVIDGAGNVCSAPLFITIRANEKPTITASCGPNGKIRPSGIIKVKKGDSKTFIIKPIKGYTVEDVIVDDQSKGQIFSYIFENVDTDHTIYASFKKSRWIITAEADQHGKIRPSGQIKVNEGDSKTFIFKPEKGYVVENVFVDNEPLGAILSYTFETVSADHSIRVTCKPILWTITASSDENGSIDPSAETAVIEGRNQTFTFTPKPHYTVDKVFVDDKQVTVTNNSYTFKKVSANHAIRVTFKKLTWTITASADENGTIDPSKVTSVIDGSDQTFTFTPQPHYIVDQVFVDDQRVTVTGDSYTFEKVSANHSIRVTFKKLTWTITASAGSNGKVSPSGDKKVDDGATVTYEMKPNKGFKVKDVIVDGVSKGALKSFTFENVTSNHTISATFTASQWIITATSGPNGKTIPEGATIIKENEIKIYTFKPNKGYKVADVLVNGVSVGAVNSYTFSGVTSHQTIHVTFEQIVWIITVTAGPNGKINPSGAVQIIEGEAKEFVIKPNNGYTVADVLVNGISVGAVSSYLFQNVTSPQKLHAEFTTK